MTSALGGYGLVVPDEKKKPSLVACVGQEQPGILRVWKQGIKVEANLDEKASLSLANEVTKIEIVSRLLTRYNRSSLGY